MVLAKTHHVGVSNRRHSGTCRDNRPCGLPTYRPLSHPPERLSVRLYRIFSTSFELPPQVVTKTLTQLAHWCLKTSPDERLASMVVKLLGATAKMKFSFRPDHQSPPEQDKITGLCEHHNEMCDILSTPIPRQHALRRLNLYVHLRVLIESLYL